MMLERYYPSNESFLKDYVNTEDLYWYIFHGFARVDINGEKKYVSVAYEKPTIMVSETPEIKEIMRPQKQGENNNSSFIKLTVKVRLIKIHHGDTLASRNMVKNVLSSDEFKETIVNYKETLDYLINEMFPGF